jgi:hypothetical protein
VTARDTVMSLMPSRTLTAIQLAERLVTVFKAIEDLDPGAQREVLEAAIATCERLEKRS